MSSPAVVTELKPKAKRGHKKSDVVDIVPPPVTTDVPTDDKPKKARAPPKKKDDVVDDSAVTTDDKPKKARAPPKKKDDVVDNSDVPTEDKPKKVPAKKKQDVVDDSDVPTEEKTKKPRAPTLPAKFAKFIQFGFWFMKKVNGDGATLLNIDEDAFLQQIHLFDTVDLQQTFVQEFFDQSKDNLKTIRSIIKDRNKTFAKAAKANAPKKPRATRQKKTTNNHDHDPLVNHLLSLATNQNLPLNNTTI